MEAISGRKTINEIAAHPLQLLRTPKDSFARGDTLLSEGLQRLAVFFDGPVTVDLFTALGRRLL